MRSTQDQSARNLEPWTAARDRIPERRLPAWLLSLAFHASVLIAAGTMLQFAPQGIMTEADRTAGITLVKHAAGEREYFDANDALAAERVSPTASGVDSPFPGRDEIWIDTTALLPADNVGAGNASDDVSAAPRPGQLGGGTARGTDVGGSARTGVFGVYGEGSRFVYVFDRSGSMDFMGGRPLRAAKQELAASLHDLARTHQFQIIFYNEAPSPFNPHGGRATMEWADEATKDLAGTFVRNMTATGGTSHMLALRMAIRLHPDVIFFLTDADEPRMSGAELRQIRRTNQGTSINAVEFGFGPQQNRENFLVRLAEQNGGQHVYVDISKLPAGD